MLGKALQIAIGNGIATGDVAEAIDFDGTNDYLSRSSDLTGNTNGKTFTFSAWVWFDGNPSNTSYVYSSHQSLAGGFDVMLSASVMYISGYLPSSNSNAFYAEVSTLQWTKDTWVHILCSADLTNTSNRGLYINDVSVSTSWPVYTNTNIGFSTSSHKIAIDGAGSAGRYKGRLSNVYLDYTYRDLSVTNNRRLFVTADLKPADGQASLNPILYLPMDDPTQPGLNAGTGGNFTLTGTIARSGRGPNQYNAPYSDFDGTADYLSKSSALTGAANGTSFTCSFVLNSDNITTTKNLFASGSGGTDHLIVSIQYISSVPYIQFRAVNTAASANLLIARAPLPNGGAVGRNYQVVASFDLTNTSTRFVYINGEAVSVTYVTYTNGSMLFTSSLWAVASLATGTGIWYDGRLGALWFNTSYIDLSVAANLAKFVTGTGIDAKPVDLGANGELPTGTAPLIYLPMYGNNAGKNYGTGGDFTVNSGPYTGARGPNEFWGNKADFDGTTGYLSKTSLSGVADSKTFSVSFFVQPDSTGQYFLFSTTGESIRIDLRPSIPRVGIIAENSSGTTILNALSSANASTSEMRSVMISIDLNNTANRTVVIDGVVDSSVTWTTYTNDTIDFTVSTYYIGTDPALSAKLNGKLSEFYFTTEYIDFSQEANRLKFRDAFGNPVNLTQQIEDAAIPNPAIYMRFDPASFGTNTGTGGNFTVNGTITDGGQL